MLKGKKESEITQEEKDKRTNLSELLADLEEKRHDILSKAGAENDTVKQLVDLALLGSGILKGEALTKFIQRSVSLIGK